MTTKRFLLTLAMVFTLIFAFAIMGCNDSSSKSTANCSDDNNTSDDKDTNNAPNASELRQCTLCDDGQSLFEDNLWLGEKYGDKVFYIVLHAEKITDARKVYIAGINDDNELVIHNQRNIAGEIDPARLDHVFGANFYKFGPEEIVNPKDSVEIEMVGLMTKSPLLKDLIDPAFVGINEPCGKSYPVTEKNWESKFPTNALLYAYDKIIGKVKFNQKRVTEVSTFDCQRNLLEEVRIEAQSLMPLGPRIATTDGSIAGEVINSNPPVRTVVTPPPVTDPVEPPSVDPPVTTPTEPPVTTVPDPVLTLKNCQNDVYIIDPDNSSSYNFQDPLNIGELFAEVNSLGDDEYKIEINLKVSAYKVVTIQCWTMVAEGYDVAGGDLDLNDLDIGFEFSDQYHPQNGGQYDTVWLGIIDSTCYSNYNVGSRNWQSYIQELTVFVEVNRLHVDGLHKIKMNVRVGNKVYSFDCIRDVEDHRTWSTSVLADHVNGYQWTFQGIPDDAYDTEDTVWIAVSSKNKPRSMR